MAHMIDMTNGRANIAFMGPRDDIWHRMGQGMEAGQDIDAWVKAAGLDWTAELVDAYAETPNGMVPVPGGKHVCRSDNWAPLGFVSDRYEAVQPRECLEWLQRYISADDRFTLDVAGSLKGGAVIWATAKFEDGMKVAGEAHKARLLMTTTLDGSGATSNSALMTRVVCDNTLRAGLMGATKSTIKTRHNTKFNAGKVHRELAEIAAGFTQYKTMAEAMALTPMPVEEISKYFKAVLEIPFDAKVDDISAKKRAQFAGLNASYSATVAEGTERATAWAALNAVTRYVDHDRATRGNGGGDAARFLSANFGSGDVLKGKACALLDPNGHIMASLKAAEGRDSVPVPASFAALV